MLWSWSQIVPGCEIRANSIEMVRTGGRSGRRPFTGEASKITVKDYDPGEYSRQLGGLGEVRRGSVRWKEGTWPLMCGETGEIELNVRSVSDVRGSEGLESMCGCIWSTTSNEKCSKKDGSRSRGLVKKKRFAEWWLRKLCETAKAEKALLVPLIFVFFFFFLFLIFFLAFFTPLSCFFRPLLLS